MWTIWISLCCCHLVECTSLAHAAFEKNHVVTTKSVFLKALRELFYCPVSMYTFLNIVVGAIIWFYQYKNLNTWPIFTHWTFDFLHISSGCLNTRHTLFHFRNEAVVRPSLCAAAP